MRNLIPQTDGPIHHCARVSVVYVLLDEHVTGGGDLPLQLDDPALNGALLPLSVCAHARIENGLCHRLH